MAVQISNAHTTDSNTRPYILVIDPACQHPELDCFNYWSTRSPLPMTYHAPVLSNFESLPTETQLDRVKGVIMLGSGASVVDDKTPWIQPLTSWLKAYLNEEKPFLGLCFGHQLLAHICGSKISFLHNNQTKESGIRHVTMNASPINEAGIYPMLVSHREIICQLPTDFEVWGSSTTVAFEAIKHKTLPFYGIQAHPEATAGFFRNQKVALTYNHSQFEQARSLIDGFISSCLSSDEAK